MFPLDEPTKPFSIEMVLLDAEDGNIQASIRKPMMKKFKDLVVEGETKGTRCESLNIPHIGLVPFNSQMILETGGQSDYFMDFIGLLVAVFSEKRPVRDGRTTRVVQMEPMDDK
ncbi:hypothetical protein SESBI_46462 [Sesbania bispinosa]|nr:hypothetical protein SESBI_46462 [Sesbania bispinosa]